MANYHEMDRDALTAEKAALEQAYKEFQGCKSVTQIEIMPKPVEGPEDPKNPWPNWPRTLKTTTVLTRW